MIEKVSDLINDDLTKYHTNPQSIENWCHRNSVPNLISGNYVPIILIIIMTTMELSII